MKRQILSNVWVKITPFEKDEKLKDIYINILKVKLSKDNLKLNYTFKSLLRGLWYKQHNSRTLLYLDLSPEIETAIVNGRKLSSTQKKEIVKTIVKKNTNNLSNIIYYNRKFHIKIMTKEEVFLYKL